MSADSKSQSNLIGVDGLIIVIYNIEPVTEPRYLREEKSKKMSRIEKKNKNKCRVS